MPNRLIDTRVQTRRDYPPDYVNYRQFLLVRNILSTLSCHNKIMLKTRGTANARAGKSTAKKVAALSGVSTLSGSWFSFPFSLIVLFCISPVLHNLSTYFVVEKEKPFKEIW